MKRTPIERSILLTLSYSSLFQFPLKSQEIVARHVKTTSKSFSSKLILKNLRKMSDVAECNGYFYLHQISSPKDIKQRKQREQWSQTKWENEVTNLTKILKKIPLIQEAYITGSLAVNNVRSLQDDIDILIVSRQNTLWLTRLLVIFVTVFMGRYRLHDTTGKNSWCFNLWLEPSSLILHEERRNLYTAYEIIQAKQIIGQNNSLLTKNIWITNFLNIDLSNFPKNNEDQKNTSFLVFAINKLCYHFQLIYMATRMTNETVSLDRAFFHPRNTQNLVRKQFSKLRKKYQI